MKGIAFVFFAAATVLAGIGTSFILDDFGADALRAYMINSPVLRAEPRDSGSFEFRTADWTELAPRRFRT